MRRAGRIRGARRVNIHGCENGLDIDGNVTVEDSFIHDQLHVGDLAPFRPRLEDGSQPL